MCLTYQGEKSEYIHFYTRNNEGSGMKKGKKSDAANQDEDWSETERERERKGNNMWRSRGEMEREEK